MNDNNTVSGAAVVAELRRSVVGGVIVKEILPNAVYTSAAAGELLHRSARWIGKQCRAGNIQAVNNGGWQIPGAALLTFIQGGARKK